MKKIIICSVSIFLVASCASVPKSNFKSVDTLPSQQRNQNEFNVCRDGAIADKHLLNLYFDNEFVEAIPVSAFLKSRYKVLYEPSVSLIAVKQGDGKTVMQYNITEKTPKQIYVLISSETTSFVPIPLPGFVYTKMKGNRKVQAVSKQVFNESCGDVSETILLKKEM